MQITPPQSRRMLRRLNIKRLFLQFIALIGALQIHVNDAKQPFLDMINHASESTLIIMENSDARSHRQLSRKSSLDSDSNQSKGGKNEQKGKNDGELSFGTNVEV